MRREPIPASPTALRPGQPWERQGGGGRAGLPGSDLQPPTSRTRRTGCTWSAWSRSRRLQHLIVDCRTFTALNNGVQAIGSIRHSGDFRWMILEPGSNTISVTATSPGGTLTTTVDIPYHA